MLDITQEHHHWRRLFRIFATTCTAIRARPTTNLTPPPVSGRVLEKYQTGVIDLPAQNWSGGRKLAASIPANWWCYVLISMPSPIEEKSAVDYTSQNPG